MGARGHLGGHAAAPTGAGLTRTRAGWPPRLCSFLRCCFLRPLLVVGYPVVVTAAQAISSALRTHVRAKAIIRVRSLSPRGFRFSARESVPRQRLMGFYRLVGRPRGYRVTHLGNARLFY